MKKIAYVFSFIVIMFVFSSCSSNSNTIYADTDFEHTIIEKTKEIINEKNYFQCDDSEIFLVGYDICYDIYSDGNDYFVVLPYEDIVYAFSKYDNNLYYIGTGDYSGLEKVSSGTFCIDDVQKPNYNENDNSRVTRYLDYDVVCQSVINNYYTDEFYTVYLLNSFPWDKSNYLNGSEQINVMIVDRNNYVFVSYCYFSANGWNVGTPGVKFNQSEYPKLTEKYKSTSVYSKSNINVISEN